MSRPGFEPFDITRPDEYQGRMNRLSVISTAIFGYYLAVFGLACAVISLIFGAPLWSYGFAAVFMLLGGLAGAYWTRAWVRSRPPRPDSTDSGSTSLSEDSAGR